MAIFASVVFTTLLPIVCKVTVFFSHNQISTYFLQKKIVFASSLLPSFGFSYSLFSSRGYGSASSRSSRISRASIIFCSFFPSVPFVPSGRSGPSGTSGLYSSSASAKGAPPKGYRTHTEAPIAHRLLPIAHFYIKLVII